MSDKSETDAASKSFRPQGKPLTLDEKWLVLNIYQRCRDELLSQNKPTSNAYQRAAYYAGVSRKIVVKIVSYYRKTGTVPPSVEAGNQSNHKTSINYNATSHLRQFIFEYHVEGTACTSKHIQDFLNNKFQWDVPLRTVQRHLHRLGFEYKKNKIKKRTFREKPSIRQQRHTYLYDIQKIRQEGYTMVYLDESFLHHYHAQQFSWFSEDDFLDVPSGKGKRWCFIHAISEQNMIPNCIPVFEGKKHQEDYHGSFNFEVFYNWFQNNLLPNLHEKSCIVMDRATYHMVPEERLTPSQMKKSDIQKWLTEHDIHWEEYWLKPQLVTTIDEHIDRTPIVQKEAHKKGHKLLIWKGNHPEFNPIELVWAFVKNECAKKHRNDITFKEVLENLKESFNHLSGEMCQNCYQHVIKKEKELWTLDLELDSIDEFLNNDAEKLRLFLTHL